MAKRTKRNSLPPDSLPPPSAEEIFQLWRMKTDEQDEARLIRLANEFRRLTRLTHQLRIPDAYKAITKEVRTPFVRDTWHRTVAALNQKPYVVHIEPRDKLDETARSCSIGEKWDSATRDALDKDLNLNTSVESAKALVRDGESVLKIVHRPDAWATFPRREETEDADSFLKRVDKMKKGAPLPFAWRVVDRLTTVWQDGEFGDEWVVEMGAYPRSFVRRRYGMVENAAGNLVDPATPYVSIDGELVGGVRENITPQSMLGGTPKPWGSQTSPFGQCLKAEYFDKDWWAVVVDGAMAPNFPKPNPYAPRLPYIRAKGPDSESLLYSLLFLVPTLDELLTMKLNWAHLGAYPNPVIHAVPNAAGPSPLGEDGTPPLLQWRPGKALTFPAGWTIDFLQPPPVGADINHLVQILQGLIDIAGIPSVLRGQVPGDASGYLANQIMSVASLAFQMAGNALSQQFEKAFELMHYMVGHNIQQTVYVLAGPGTEQEGKQWLGLRPGDGSTATVAGIGDLGPVSVHYRPTLPTNEQALAMIAMQLVNAPKPLMSQRRALEKYIQEEDADAVLDEIAVEEALNSEPLRSLWINKAVRDAGLEPPENAPPNAPTPPLSGINDVANAGQPAIPGLNQPLQPPPPEGVPGAPGGRVAGSYPGLPGTPGAPVGPVG